ncbi:MAG TPA: M14 family zinc carboxypeptidase [Solirubrobacterales bacterium]
MTSNRRHSARLLASLAVAAAALVLASPAAANQRTVIGHSVEGRAIFAVREGRPGRNVRVLVVGCIHGDETAGMRVARGLLARRAPRGAELWVVPTLNPDGVAAGTRGNAHGVDLNRNFPFAWLPLGGGEYSGPRPLSEPESRAAVRLIRRIRPQVTIWFHQPFGVVDSSGGDVFVERRFSQLIGLPLVRLRRYPGSAARWQNHALPGSTAFVAELPALVRAGLVRRAVGAVLGLAGELASPGVGGAKPRAG